MIDLYYWPTPNGHKITIALEEMQLDYAIKAVNIGKGEQFDPAFLAFSPNNRMPAIIDNDGPDGTPVTVFESGAILLYLAEKTGKLIAGGSLGRKTTLEWLFWQMGGFGPMLGQAHHFFKYAPEKVEYAQNRYAKEANRLYGVLDRQLAENPWVAGADYSIADIAIYPWTRTYYNQGVVIEEYNNVMRWRQAMGQREAVRKGMQVGAELREDLSKLSPEEWSRLFNTGPAG